MRGLGTLSLNTQFTTLSEHIMSKNVALSLLAEGNTGAEILSILDALVADNVSADADNDGAENVTDI
jgi:hypothetical protein